MVPAYSRMVTHMCAFVCTDNDVRCSVCTCKGVISEVPTNLGAALGKHAVH
jgi:hypothetical protein